MNEHRPNDTEEGEGEEKKARDASSPITAPSSTNNKPCCFFYKYGVCEPPRGYCRFDHVNDDGVTPCCFGPSCRMGHAKRIQELNKATTTLQQRVDYWTKGGGRHFQNSGDRPAQRNANDLAAQLEPFKTAVLKDRLVTVFKAAQYEQLEGLSRQAVMQQLLDAYAHCNLTHRKRIRVQGTPGQDVSPVLQAALMVELVAWRTRHLDNNTRPSINAQAYMILRKDCLEGIEPLDGHDDDIHSDDAKTSRTSTDQLLLVTSRKARRAHKKMQPYTTLWTLARSALAAADADFAARFSALAVTYQFRGSPHIDKQNTGPFYGLSLGAFSGCGHDAPADSGGSGGGGGGGGICVEAAYDTIAVCDTHNRFAKVDGRYPHWVDDYEGERYSLIYYSTDTSIQEYQKPSVAYYGDIVMD